MILKAHEKRTGGAFQVLRFNRWPPDGLQQRAPHPKSASYPGQEQDGHYDHDPGLMALVVETRNWPLQTSCTRK